MNLEDPPPFNPLQRDSPPPKEKIIAQYSSRHGTEAHRVRGEEGGGVGRGGRDRKGKEIYDTHTPLNGVEMQPSLGWGSYLYSIFGPAVKCRHYWGKGVVYTGTFPPRAKLQPPLGREVAGYIPALKHCFCPVSVRKGRAQVLRRLGPLYFCRAGEEGSLNWSLNIKLKH